MKSQSENPFSPAVRSACLVFGLLDLIVRALTKGALYAAAALAVALALLGTAEVLFSQLFNRAIPSAFEFQEALMGLTVFGALASVQYYRAHISVDIFTSRLAGGAKFIAELITLLAGTLLFTLFSWQSYILAMRSLAIRELSPGFVPFPLYLIKACVFICCLIGLLEFLRQLVRHAIGRADSTSS
ncbi:TRAP transporter small permease [Pelagibius marinus]|uniref:TRAP transporter small permease n=1 Tax=Pelagibius marinus TaxID=2762760 RepID=UPI001872771D|nr:TRAP transporter small permease [Pelagibius marinus]